MQRQNGRQTHENLGNWGLQWRRRLSRGAQSSFRRTDCYPRRSTLCAVAGSVFSWTKQTETCRSLWRMQTQISIIRCQPGMLEHHGKRHQRLGKLRTHGPHLRRSPSQLRIQTLNELATIDGFHMTICIGYLPVYGLLRSEDSA